MLTLAQLDALLDRYQAMAAAALANDWERLASLEQEAAALREAARLAANKAEPDLSTLDAETKAAMQARIEQILALDGEIRSHTDPFLASVRKLLGSGRQREALRQAYGAFSP